LVTGAQGFIGSFLVKYILKNYPKTTVIGITRNSSIKNRLRLEDAWDNSRFQMVYLDFSKDNMTEYFQEVDYVFHVGAKTAVDHSILDPEPYIQSNVIGTYKLLEAARKSRTIKCFFHISTDEVYGSCSGEAFTEDSTLLPGNPYSMTKAASDMFVLGYHNTYGLPTITTRTENVYGIYQGIEKAMPTFIKQLLSGNPMTLYGDGLHQRRWIHVEDKCSALLYLLEYGKIGETYNIAGEGEMTNIQFAEKIAKVLNLPANIEFISDNKIRPGHDKRYAIDVSKLKSLGWKPIYSLDTGFEDVVNWYKNNKYWLL